MEIRLLKYFVAVAEELHFSNAARRLHISQPPLSQQIMKFEDELGVKLFNRNKRSVSLTPAGKVLLTDARNILRSVERAGANLDAVKSGTGGSFNLSYINPALDSFLSRIILEYKTAYPRVFLNLSEMGTNEQIEAVRSGVVDAGVVRLFGHDVSDLSCVLIHRESYALAVPRGHVFQGRGEINICELAGESLIFFPRERQPLLYDEWMGIFSGYGFVPHVVQEVVSKSASVALVAAHMGLAIVPESMRRRNQEGVVFKKMSGNSPNLEIHLLYRKEYEFPALVNFLKITQNVASIFE